jgi:hypothetical protein
MSRHPSRLLRRSFALLSVIGALLAAGCADDGGGAPTPTPTPTPVPKRVALVTWGYSGMLWAGSLSTSCDEIRMLKNTLQTLAQRETGIRVLYATDSACDPRTSANFCSLVSDWSRLAPFFSMIDSIGTIEFKAYSSVDPYAYDVTILDCCRTGLTTLRTSLLNYIDTVAHGGVLVVGSNSCYRSGTASSQLANTIVQTYGMTITTEDPTARGCYAVPAEKRTGILREVTQLDLFRVAPQVVVAPGRSVFENAGGQSIIAVYEKPLS